MRAAIMSELPRTHGYARRHPPRGPTLVSYVPVLYAARTVLRTNAAVAAALERVDFGTGALTRLNRNRIER